MICGCVQKCCVQYILQINGYERMGSMMRSQWMDSGVPYWQTHLMITLELSSVNLGWVWRTAVSQSWLETTRQAQVGCHVYRSWKAVVGLFSWLWYGPSRCNWVEGSRGIPSDESEATTRGQQWWTCCTTPWATRPSEKASLSGWKSVRALLQVSDSLTPLVAKLSSGTS